MFKGSEIISVVVYILLNIYLRLCFCCRLSTFTPDFFTLDSRLFTRDSRLFTPDSRHLLSTLDNYPRLLTFTLKPRLLDTLLVCTLKFLRITLQLYSYKRDSVLYSNRKIGLFFHALPNKRIKELLQTPFN